MSAVGVIKDLWLIQNAVGFVSIMAHNVSTLGEEADLKAQTFSLAQTPIESTNLHLALKPLFCQTCVITSAFYEL